MEQQPATSALTLCVCVSLFLSLSLSVCLSVPLLRCGLAGILLLPLPLRREETLFGIGRSGRVYPAVAVRPSAGLYGIVDDVNAVEIAARI